MSEMRMTETEFRAYLEQAFDDGTRSALVAVNDFATGLLARLDATTPDPNDEPGARAEGESL